MKKKMCECSGCRKTATVRLRNGHWICEDCMKYLRKAKHTRKVRGFYKEVYIGRLGVGYFGPGDPGIAIYNDVFVKL